MRREYRFRVQGELRLDQSHAITLNGRVYRFHTTPDTQRVDAITVETRADDPADWPTVTSLPPDAGNPKAPKVHINMTSPAWPLILEDLQTIEGLLSFYGLDSIDTTNSSQRYLPDGASEAQQLAIFDFSTETHERDDREFSITGFDIVARNVLAAAELQDLQIALSFFRKGGLDMRAQRYIEAFCDYFFVVETLFAEGKSRGQAMKDAFAASSLLLDATTQTMRGQALAVYVRDNPQMIPRLNDRYVRPTAIDTLASLIETRGFLHHHSGKRPRAWHPDRQADFGADATVIQEIAFKVLFKLTSGAIFSDAAVERYQKLFAGVVRNGAGNGGRNASPDGLLELGVLAYGSLIDDLGPELGSRVQWCIPNVETPFPVEFARTSASRDGAPTLVPVERGGARVRAVIFALDSTLTMSEGANLLWRRETRETGDRHYQPKPTVGPNDVVVEQLNGFEGFRTVLYTRIGANIPMLTAQRLAELAILSTKCQAGQVAMDGISYLLNAKRRGIRTPLMPGYEAAILEMTGSTSLEAARETASAI